jgi:hypothetical protein
MTGDEQTIDPSSQLEAMAEKVCSGFGIDIHDQTLPDDEELPLLIPFHSSC